VLVAVTQHAVGPLTATAYAQLFPADPTATPSPTVDALEAMLASNPHKATAFLQALLSVMEAQALMMVWRISHGDEIVSVSVKYHESDRFELVVDVTPSFEPVGWTGFVPDWRRGLVEARS